jgi:hypothetical protein
MTMQTVWLLSAAGLMLAWLVLAVLGQRKTSVPNAVVLQYGPVLRTFALILALTPALLMVFMIGTVPIPSQARMNLLGLSCLVAGVICGLPLIESIRVQLVVTEEGVTRYSPWVETATLKWIEVERVGYSALNRWFTLHGAGRTIRVSRHLSGLGAFVELLRRHVAAERCTGAAAVLDTVK